MISLTLEPGKIIQFSTSASQKRISVLSDWQWVKRIKNALAKNQFRLYFQQATALQTLDSRHYCEVLLRLVDEDGNLISPAIFLPIAERYQLMPQVEQWIFDAFLDQLVHANPEIWENYRFAINLSEFHLRNYQFIDKMHQKLMAFGVPTEVICFEIQETVALSNLKLASEFITELQTLGYCFALDNCGSRMSSFTYLKYLPVDYLKIDESFVKNMKQDIADKAIVEIINYLGQIMGLQTIAKGVESPEIFAEVNTVGVDYAQGYYLAQPQPMNLSTIL
ncbi:MAG: EAL domain-containing protein [Microcoleaceae cyanobacterium]